MHLFIEMKTVFAFVDGVGGEGTDEASGLVVLPALICSSKLRSSQALNGDWTSSVRADDASASGRLRRRWIVSLHGRCQHELCIVARLDQSEQHTHSTHLNNIDR